MAQSFEVGTALNPYIAQFLVKSLVEAIEPKGSRKQRHEQEALAKLAEYQPMVSKLPESEKKDFYNKFFGAYGMSEPPWLRGLFGAGPEPVLPLPEGSVEKGRFVKGPFRIGGRMQTQYIIPQTKPFKFEREEPAPLMPPSKVRELKSFGLTDEDIRDLLKEQPSQLKMVMSASKLYSQAKAAGKSDEEALNSLGELRAPYEDYQHDRELKKQQIEAGVTAKGESSYIAREREKRLTEEGKVKKSYMEAQIEIARGRELRLSKNTALASQAKNQQALLALAQKAFAEDRRTAIAQNRLELDKAVKAQMMGETYLRNEIPVPLDFEDWLENDGRAFRERFKQLGGEEGATPPGAGPPPAQSLEKRKGFEKRHGL